ncbi:MAG: chorismate-binding protein, partial [Limisphaerales bacterium]
MNVRPLIQEIQTLQTPESLVAQLQPINSEFRVSSSQFNIVLLRSGFFESAQARYSFVAAKPFLTFRSFGSRCEIAFADSGHLSLDTPHTQFGNPWQILDALMSRYEMLDEVDLPFPLGGCFGYWGYDLKNFVEPKLPRRALNDLELPDCAVGFYDSLVVFDHRLGKTWIISTGLEADGSRSETKAKEQVEFWNNLLRSNINEELPQRLRGAEFGNSKLKTQNSKLFPRPLCDSVAKIVSNFSRAEFISKVERVQKYIRAGDIYQVNLSQRLMASCELSGWEFFQNLSEVSPAPFSAFLDCGEFQICSSSPESFLRMSGSQIQTRPIKGTRPRSADANRDAQFTYELQTSP